VRVDTGSGSIEPVWIAEPGLGATGLLRVGGRIYVVLRAQARSTSEPERSDIAVLCAKTLRELDRWRVPDAADLHSLACDGDTLYAVSTGTDELLALPLDGPGRGTVTWRPAGATDRLDGHHLNGLLLADGELYISGFGPKPAGADWKEARDGFLCRIDGPVLRQGLRHPHSILELDTTFVICESPSRLALALDGRRSDTLPGYTRGLCLADDALYVGTSMGRRRSKSTGTLNNLAAPGGFAVEGACALVRLDPATLSLSSTLSLAAYGRELYDLLPL